MVFICLCLLAMAGVWAYLEVQIEGRDGWAASLPCWKVTRGPVVWLLQGRPWTGYHTAMIAFILLTLHYPSVFHWQWDLGEESFVWGAFFGFLLVEDFLWFVFNPHYGLRRFKRENVPWHPRWLGPIPDFYVFYAVLSSILIVASHVWF